MEHGTVKFFHPREDQRYGVIIPDAGGRDTHFKLFGLKAVEAALSRDAQPILIKPTSFDRIPKQGDRVVFRRSSDSFSAHKTKVWAFEDEWIAAGGDAK